MNAVEILMRMYDGMSMDEKREVIKRIGATAKDDGLIPEPEESESKAKKKRRGGSFKSYWMKSATGIDTTKKGMFRVEGDWVNDIGKDTSVGDLVIVGAKDPKKYMLTRVTKSASDSIEVDSFGRKNIIEGVALLVADERFAGIESEVRAQL